MIWLSSNTFDPGKLSPKVTFLLSSSPAIGTCVDPCSSKVQSSAGTNDEEVSSKVTNIEGGMLYFFIM